jgi:hypothetical protein
MFWNLFPSRKNNSNWKVTQESFITIINLFEALNAFKKSDGSDMTANELAELFMKIMKVDISPYPDFETMRICVQPELPLEDTIAKMIEILEEDLRIQNALEDTGVLLSEEEQRRSLVLNFLTSEFMQEIRKFVSFLK